MHRSIVYGLGAVVSCVIRTFPSRRGCNHHCGRLICSSGTAMVCFSGGRNQVVHSKNYTGRRSHSSCQSPVRDQGQRSWGGGAVCCVPCVVSNVRCLEPDARWIQPASVVVSHIHDIVVIVIVLWFVRSSGTPEVRLTEEEMRPCRKWMSRTRPPILSTPGSQPNPHEPKLFPL